MPEQVYCIPKYRAIKCQLLLVPVIASLATWRLRYGPSSQPQLRTVRDGAGSKREFSLLFSCLSFLCRGKEAAEAKKEHILVSPVVAVRSWLLVGSPGPLLAVFFFLRLDHGEVRCPVSTQYSIELGESHTMHRLRFVRPTKPQNTLAD